MILDQETTNRNYEHEFREMLSHQTIQDLRVIAENRHITIKGNRKQPIVDEIATQLCILPAIRVEISALNDLQRAVLVYMHLLVGQAYGATSDNIAKEFPIEGQSKHEIRQAMTALNLRGLLLIFKKNQITYYLLPQAVRICLPPLPILAGKNESQFFPVYPQEKIEQLEIRATLPAVFPKLLYIVWNYIDQRHPRQHPVPPRRPVEDQWPQLQEWRHLPAEVQELTNKKHLYYGVGTMPMTVPVSPFHLSLDDLEALCTQAAYSKLQIEFCYSLLESIGAIAGKPGKTITSDKEIFQRLLSLPLSQQIQAIARAWISDTHWSEMDIMLRTNQNIRLRRNVVYTSYKPSHLYQELRYGRLGTLNFLSVLEENRWVTMEGLLKTIFEINHNIVHMHSDTQVWWLESVRTKKQFGTTFDDWQKSYGLFIHAVITGPLAWLGIVSLGYDQDKLVALKLTPAGSFALGRRSTLEEKTRIAPQDAVKMKDDLTVTLVPGQVPVQLYDLLHLLGDVLEATPQRFVYRITADGLLGAFEQGETLETIVTALEEQSGQAIPDIWHDKLETWSQNYGKLHIYEDITVIELADDYAIQELLINTSLHKYLIYQFSPRLVAIQPDAVELLVQEMEKRGYTPRVEQS